MTLFADGLSTFSVMMQFEYDPELLIAEVKKRPALWHVVHPDYRAKHVKSKLWNEIVRELMSVDANTKEVTRAEMRELELQLQKKWKSLRDCYQKYLANPNRTKKPYVFSKHLEFINKDKESVPKRSRGQTSESDEEVPYRRKWKRRHRLNLTKDESDGGVEELDDYQEDITIKPEPDLGIQAEQFVFASVDNQSQARSGDFDDTDRMFLISLLPHLKAIPEEFRLNVKVELMNVLRTAYEDTSRLKSRTNESR